MKKAGWIRRDLEKARAWLERKSPLPKVNKARKAKRRELGEVYGRYHVWVCTRPCILASYPKAICFGPVCGHHLKTVAAGGKDAENEVSLCVTHHSQLHNMGERRFEEIHGCDLDLHAAALWSRYCEAFEPA